MGGQLVRLGCWVRVLACDSQIGYYGKPPTNSTRNLTSCITKMTCLEYLVTAVNRAVDNKGETMWRQHLWQTQPRRCTQVSYRRTNQQNTSRDSKSRGGRWPTGRLHGLGRLAWLWLRERGWTRTQAVQGIRGKLFKFVYVDGGWKLHIKGQRWIEHQRPQDICTPATVEGGFTRHTWKEWWASCSWRTARTNQVD